jgi:hypothetical protein
VTGDRWAILGLAPARAPWFRQVTGWAMAGILPLDFVKCVSVEEVTARLRSASTFSAVILDGSLPGVDRDLLQRAARLGVAPVVVASPTSTTDWSALGAVASLQPDFARSDLLEILESHGRPLAPQTVTTAPPPPVVMTAGSLVAMVGRCGSGVSTLAAALAQGLAAEPANGGRVLLADLARRADQALLHDSPDVVPGLQELTEAHRGSTPSTEQVRAMTFAVPGRGYDLLLGLRRSRDWVTLRPSSFEAALGGLRRAYHVVVTDIDDDFEGADEGGSVDVEERNLPARTTCRHADVVVAVGTPTLVGVRALVRLLDELGSLGVPASRIQPVVNGAPSRQRERAELNRAIADLVASDDRHLLPAPLHLPQRRGVEDVHRNGTRFAPQLVEPLAGAIRAAFARCPQTAPSPAGPSPTPVAPGSLGSAVDLFDEDAP